MIDTYLFSSDFQKEYIDILTHDTAKPLRTQENPQIYRETNINREVKGVFVRANQNIRQATYQLRYYHVFCETHVDSMYTVTERGETDNNKNY